MAGSSPIRFDRFSIAAEVVTRQLTRAPESPIWRREGGAGVFCEEAQRHLEVLAEAVTAESAELFIDYVGWLKVVLLRRALSLDDLIAQLGLLLEILGERLPEPDRTVARTIIARALEALPGQAEDVPDALAASPRAGLARAYLDRLLARDRRGAIQLVLDAAERGVPVRELYLEVFQPVQREIGRRWQRNELSVAEEHFITAATQLAIAQLYPRVFETPRTGRLAVVSCVAGEQHELGARMLADLLELDGCSCVYLGASTPTADVVQMLVSSSAPVLGVSATLTTSLTPTRDLIARVRGTPSCARVKIIVGGLAFDARPGLWRNVGADAFAHDAAAGVRTVASLSSAAAKVVA